jgi:hypothetical protein
LFLGAMFVFQVAVFNARLANHDTLEQLAATVHLVHTGHLGLTDDEFRRQVLPRLGADPDTTASRALIGLWVRRTGGRWYEVHDPGNKVLMAPAVLLATALGQQSRESATPSSTTKVLATASIGAFGVLLTWFLFLALRFVLTDRRAMRWSALGLVATILLPYSKQTWDVFPCAVLVAGVAWLSLRRLARREGTYGPTIALFAVAGAASWFRFSFGPLLLLGCVLVDVLAGLATTWDRRALARRVVLGVVTFVLVCVPVFVVNALATGNPLVPPVTREGQTLFARVPFGGALGLLVSPNRGLFVFAPVLLLAFGVVVLWRSLTGDVRRYVGAWAIPLAAYVIALGGVETWSAFGWGPRFLVPMVPLLWIPTAVVGARCFDGPRSARASAGVLLALSIGVAAVAVTTNWDAVSAIDDDYVSSQPMYPAQIVETARYIGGRIPLRNEGTSIDEGIDTKQWPDLAVFYAARKRGVPDAIAALAVLVLLAIAGALFYGAARTPRAPTG